MQQWTAATSVEKAIVDKLVVEESARGICADLVASTRLEYDLPDDLPDSVLEDGIALLVNANLKRHVARVKMMAVQMKIAWSSVMENGGKKSIRTAVQFLRVRFRITKLPDFRKKHNLPDSLPDTILIFGLKAQARRLARSMTLES